MLIQTPKGIYIRMGEKIIKIKLPASLLSSLESPSNDLEDFIPQMAVNKQSKNRVSRTLLCKDGPMHFRVNS